jgi:hypothetical protein
MANSTTAFGAQDFMHAFGSQRTEELEIAWIKSSDPTPIFNGDLVVTSSNVVASGGFGNYITQGSSFATPTNLGWRGVFRGCEYYSAVSQKMIVSRYYPGQGVTGTTSVVGGDVKAFIVSDTNQLFIIKGSTVTVINSSNIGMAYAVCGSSLGSSQTGNTTTGNSGLMLGSSTAIAPSSQGQATPQPFTLVDFYSNRAPANWMGLPFAGSGGAIVDGTDNTTVCQVLIVKPRDWEGNLL